VACETDRIVERGPRFRQTHLPEPEPDRRGYSPIAAIK
jgi:hypothetical protein